MNFRNNLKSALSVLMSNLLTPRNNSHPFQVTLSGRAIDHGDTKLLLSIR